MSARKPAVAKVATKVAANPAGRAKQAPAKAAAPAASADGAATQDTSDTATRLARDIDRALNEGRTDLLSEEALQALMGHSTIQMTFDTYGHLFPAPEDDQVAMQQLQARLIG